MSKFILRCNTLWYRHSEVLSFLFLNLILQIFPIIITALRTILHGVDFDYLANVDAAWILFILSLWNVSGSIRPNKQKEVNIFKAKVIFTSLAIILTFFVLWYLPEIKNISIRMAKDNLLIVISMPILLIILLGIILGIVNYYFLTPINIKLHWYHQAQFSGIYTAYLYGIFANNGIRINIVSADPLKDQPAVDRFGVFNQFAIVSGTDVPKARDRNIRLRCIKVITPSPVNVFIVPEDSTIKTIADFKGKRILYRPGYEEADILKIILLSSGLTISDIRNVDFKSTDLYSIGTNFDITAGHEAVEPLQLASKNIYTKTFSAFFSDKPIFGDVVVTTEQVITTMPNVVRAMAKSIDDGWNMVSVHPERGLKACSYFCENWSTEEEQLQKAIQDAMLGFRGLNTANNFVEFGMQDSDWIPVIDALKATNSICSELRASDMYWR